MISLFLLPEIEWFLYIDTIFLAYACIISKASENNYFKLLIIEKTNRRSKDIILKFFLNTYKQ